MSNLVEQCEIDLLRSKVQQIIEDGCCQEYDIDSTVETTISYLEDVIDSSTSLEADDALNILQKCVDLAICAKNVAKLPVQSFEALYDMPVELIPSFVRIETEEKQFL